MKTLKLQIPLREGLLEFDLIPGVVDQHGVPSAIGANVCPSCESVHVMVVPRRCFQMPGTIAGDAIKSFTIQHLDPRGIFAGLELSRESAIELAGQLLKAAGVHVVKVPVNGPPGVTH